MKHISIVVAAFVLVLGYHAVTKADAPPGVTKWEYKAIVVDYRSIGDRDESGSAEIKALPSEAELRAMYSGHDKDKDGILSKGDGPDWGGIGAREAAKYDSDGDRKVSMEEYVDAIRMNFAGSFMDRRVAVEGRDGWELVSTQQVGSPEIALIFKRSL